MQLARGDPTDVAEALHDAVLRCEVPIEPLARALDDHHDAGAGRLVSKHGAADRDRLARDDLRDGISLLHRVRVHHPGHRLLVRRHVGRRDVELWPDERRELGGEPARDARELALRHLARVAAHAALRAAVRQAQERALPGHPHRKRGALAEIDAGVVANAALRRPEHGRVLHAVGRERRVRAVVHPHREGQDQRALGSTQALRDHVRDFGQLEGVLELCRGLLEERRVPLERGCRVRDLGHGRERTQRLRPTGCNHGPIGLLPPGPIMPMLLG